jgi:hypothetical protein
MMAEEKKHPLEGTGSPGDQPRQRRATDIENLGVELISGLFMLLGLALFGLLFVQINSDPAIREATRNDTSVFLAFLDSFGIVTPLLIILIGVLFLRLGFNLRKRSVTAARWAELALLWMIVALVLYSIITFVSVGRASITLSNPTFDIGERFSPFCLFSSSSSLSFLPAAG